MVLLVYIYATFSSHLPTYLVMQNILRNMAKCVNFSFILPIEKAFFSYNWEKDIGQSDVIGPSKQAKVQWTIAFIRIAKKTNMGNGCGSVGRAVA